MGSDKAELFGPGMTQRSGQMRWTTTPEVRRDAGKAASYGPAKPSASPCCLSTGRLRSNSVAARLAETDYRTQPTGNPENAG
jgi:hypothetical protein